jgi:hypothetical protein
MANAAIGKRETGKAEKPHDYFVVPLCHYHHQSGILAQHKIGEQRFWFEVHGRNPFEIAASLWIVSGGAARALEPKPAKRERKVSARKAPEKRTKIRSPQTFPQGRKLQSRGFQPRRGVSLPLQDHDNAAE